MAELSSIAGVANTPDLRPVDKAVLLYFMATLDVWSYSPHKYETIALSVGIKARNVKRSADRLISVGIISRGADDPDAPAYARGARPYWFRFFLNPRCLVAAPRGVPSIVPAPRVTRAHPTL
jgi:hypothetical protein